MVRKGGVVASVSALLLPLLHACSEGAGERSEETDPRPEASTAISVTRLFPTAEHPGVTRPECIYTSPVAWEDDGATSILVAEGSGTVTAYDAETGSERWSVFLPAPEGEQAFATAAPALLAEAKLLVAVYHTTEPGSARHVADARLRQRVAVVDLAGRRIDPRFSPIELQASVPGHGGSVPFLPGNALSRGTVVVGRRPGEALGRAYVTFGNVRDIQPWHGWIFELDLDGWASGGTVVTAVQVTTPETDCGPAGVSGSRDRICGGGLWAPSGPLLRDKGDDYELILSPGNGQLDLERGDFASTLLRTGRGLPFEPACDPARCADIDPREPPESCTATCRDLFVPRVPAGAEPFAPESGVCDDGASMLECWSRLDYIGGSTPALARLPSGREVLVYTPKDGYAYLVSADHLGTLLDRVKLVDNCGTRSDPCTLDWAGMIVTQPEVLDAPEGPLVFVPTFMFDGTHPAGVVALRVHETEGGARLETAWTFPSFSSRDAVRLFRRHPTRPRLVREGPRGEPVLFVGEMVERQNGVLWALRATDGKLLARQPLAGAGFRFAQPLFVDGKIFLPSCASDKGPGTLEGYRITAPAR
jgi:hypothetical protein